MLTSKDYLTDYNISTIPGQTFSAILLNCLNKILKNYPRKKKRKLASIFCCNFYLAHPHQLEAHFQSPCYSQQTSIATFAHLDSIKMLYRVER